MKIPETHFVSGHRIQPSFPDGLERAVFAWAASGVPRRASGSSQASMPPRLATPAVMLPSPATSRYAPVWPDMPRPSWCCSIPSASPTRNCCACS